MADISDMERMVDDWERDAQQNAERFQAMQQQVAQISITESVASGAVSVTVGSNGIPTDVRMTDAVREMSPQEIAANVLKAMQKAQSRYPERLREITAATVGDTVAGQHIVAVAEEQFPDAPAEEPEPELPETGPKEVQVGQIGDEPPEPPSPSPPPARPAPPPRPSRPAADDDDEPFGEGSVFDR